MKFLKENYPIVGFLVAYIITKNLILAAAVWSLGSLIQIISSIIFKEPIKKSHIAYFILGLLLLAMAYWFNDESFIKWKTTIMVWAGALVILVRQIVSKKYVFIDLMDTSVEFKTDPPKSKLNKINAVWIGALTIFGGLNLYVAYNYSTDFWFYFKMIGLFVTLMGLMILSFILVAEHLNFDDEETTSKDN